MFLRGGDVSRARELKSIVGCGGVMGVVSYPSGGEGRGGGGAEGEGAAESEGGPPGADVPEGRGADGHQGGAGRVRGGRGRPLSAG